MGKSDKSVFGYKLAYKDELDLIQKIIKIFSAVKNLDKGKSYLRPKAIEVLSFYLYLGHSKSTNDLICKTLSISKENLRTINTELTKKGFLLRDMRNYHKKHINKELASLRDYFLKEGSNAIFLIKLAKTS